MPCRDGREDLMHYKGFYGDTYAEARAKYLKQEKVDNEEERKLIEWADKNMKGDFERLHTATRLLCDVLTYLNHPDVSVSTNGKLPKYSEELNTWFKFHKMEDEFRTIRDERGDVLSNLTD